MAGTQQVERGHCQAKKPIQSGWTTFGRPQEMASINARRFLLSLIRKSMLAKVGNQGQYPACSAGVSSINKSRTGFVFFACQLHINSRAGREKMNGQSYSS